MGAKGKKLYSKEGFFSFASFANLNTFKLVCFREQVEDSRSSDNFTFCEHQTMYSKADMTCFAQILTIEMINHFSAFEQCPKKAQCQRTTEAYGRLLK